MNKNYVYKIFPGDNRENRN